MSNRAASAAVICVSAAAVAEGAADGASVGASNVDAEELADVTGTALADDEAAGIVVSGRLSEQPAANKIGMKKNLMKRTRKNKYRERIAYASDSRASSTGECLQDHGTVFVLYTNERQNIGGYRGEALR